MLEAGADVNAEDSLKRTALMIAIDWKHEAIARRLLDAGANANGKDLSGEPVLTQAIREGMWQIAHLLLDTGANAHPRAKKECMPIKAASYHGSDESTKLILRLLENGAKSSDPAVLASAIERQDLKLVRALIAAGATLRSPDRMYDPLAKAIDSGKIELLRLILDAGAEVSEYAGESALLDIFFSKASDKDLIQCSEILLQAGANVNHINGSGYSPLHAATRKCRIQFAQWLLDNGADPNPLAISQGTPLDIVFGELESLDRTMGLSKSGGRKGDKVRREMLCEMISLLESAGAKRENSEESLQRDDTILSIPFCERRGLCDKTFFKAEQLLIRADIDKISDVIQKDRKFERVERDVYERLQEIEEPIGEVLALVKLKGHDWVYVAGGRGTRGDNPMKAWSKALNAPVLQVGEQSVASVVYYALFDDGKRIESFESDGQWFRGGIEIDPEVQEESDRMHGTSFQSSRREQVEIDWAAYESEWQFLESFLLEQDAYLTFVWAGFEGTDRPLRITSYNDDEAIPENIERVDLAFYKPTAAQELASKQKPPEEDLLLQAIQDGDAEAAAQALASGANLGDLPPRRNESYLLLAIQYANYHQTEEIVNLLFEAGADPDFGGDEPLLPRAVQYGGTTAQQMKIVAELLDRGADVNARKPSQSDNFLIQGGQTALIKAASNCKLNYVKLLLQRGADPTITDDAGKTALEHAEFWLREVKKDQLKDVPAFTDETYLPNAQAVVDLLEAAQEGSLDVAALPEAEDLIAAEHERITAKRQREAL